MRKRAGTRTARIYLGTLTLGIALGISATFAAPNADAGTSFDGSTATPDRSAGAEATTAIEALTTASTAEARARVPAGFALAYYEPTVEDGMLVDPDGDCSSPVPLPSEFATACKAHDLGYDLLRFGAVAGTEPTENARRALDSRLGADMHEKCKSRPALVSRTECHIMAAIASNAVTFNSFRQNYGIPDPEPALPFLIAGGVGAGVLTAAASTITPVARLRTRKAAA